jgi:hypothetical protein
VTSGEEVNPHVRSVAYVLPVECMRYPRDGTVRSSTSGRWYQKPKDAGDMAEVAEVLGEAHHGPAGSGQRRIRTESSGSKPKQF